VREKEGDSQRRHILMSIEKEEKGKEDLERHVRMKEGSLPKRGKEREGSCRKGGALFTSSKEGRGKEINRGPVKKKKNGRQLVTYKGI